jgi:hypothetical protein
MKREHAEALAALFDREPVDRAVVDRALADPEAPTLLAELAALRALAQEDVGRPDEVFYETIAPILRPRRASRWWRWCARPAFAASLLLLGGVTGFYLRTTPAPRSQTSAQSARFQPPAVTPQVSTAPARGGQTTLAPGTPSPGMRRLATGAPPPASLRLRFSQWQAHGATAGGQPE